MSPDTDEMSHTVLISYGNYGWWDVVFVPKYLSNDLERYSLPRASMRGRRWAGATQGYSKAALRDLNEYILKNGKEIWFTDGKD